MATISVLDKGLQGRFRQGFGKIEPLNNDPRMLFKKGQLLGGFHPFGHNAQIKCLS